MLLKEPYKIKGEGYSRILVVESWNSGKHLVSYLYGDDGAYFVDEYWLSRNAVEDYDHRGLADFEENIPLRIQKMKNPVVIVFNGGVKVYLKDIYSDLLNENETTKKKIKGLLTILSKIDYEAFDEDLDYGYSA